MYHNIFDFLQDAFWRSTWANNRFGAALKKIRWDDEFYADGEYYFVKGRFCFTTPTLNPFDKAGWKPSAVFPDGSVIDFKF